MTVLSGAKQSKLIAISIAPSFNYMNSKRTSVGGFTLIQTLDNAISTAGMSNFNSQPAYLLAQTTQPTCTGDEAGWAGGVKSGTVGKEVKPTSGSETIIVEGKQLVREGDTCTMNNVNTTGKYVSVNDEGTNLKDKLYDEDYLNSLPLLAGKGGNVGLIPNDAFTVGRKLTIGEELLARSMFGNDIDYSKVRVYNKKFWPPQRSNQAITPFGDIYYGSDVYKPDYSLESNSLKHLFIHEMTHVWQEQKKKSVMSRAILEQVFLESPYQALGVGEGAYNYKIKVGSSLTDYGIEEQGAIVADHWLRKNSITTIQGREIIDAKGPLTFTHYDLVIYRDIKK